MALVWVGTLSSPTRKNPIKAKFSMQGKNGRSRNVQAGLFVRSESWKPHLRLLHFSAAVVLEALKRLMSESTSSLRS